MLALVFWGQITCNVIPLSGATTSVSSVIYGVETSWQCNEGFSDGTGQNQGIYRAQCQGDGNDLSAGGSCSQVRCTGAARPCPVVLVLCSPVGVRNRKFVDWLATAADQMQRYITLELATERRESALGTVGAVGLF